MSLNQTLAALGYTTAPHRNAPAQGKAIYRDGVEVFAGTAGEVWAWLRANGEHACAHCGQRITGDYDATTDGEPLCHAGCEAPC